MGSTVQTGKNYSAAGFDRRFGGFCARYNSDHTQRTLRGGKMGNTIGMTDRQFRCFVRMIQLELKWILDEESVEKKDQALRELIDLLQMA
jgi:hypothetical protein